MQISGSCSLPGVSDASAQLMAVLHKASLGLAATPGLLAGPREARSLHSSTAKPSGKILCLFTPLLPWRIVSPNIVILRDTLLPGLELLSGGSWKSPTPVIEWICLFPRGDRHRGAAPSELQVQSQRVPFSRRAKRRLNLLLSGIREQGRHPVMWAKGQPSCL